ncbi:AI-2E family transporter [Solirubrobacter ginsenosidimutans]|uniref:AI-2E family transporter n=1 Tax=Solirubrobacter ginsenosidimutans TaxID=490573 RepID=A0A9X3S1X2_9ACTN|nr:AI-2E family transporter [Solirubrobacter ginsenosidimutans]MDA0161582.1 AI-2E family transporter [Solirubrobacter ginsenosidimutans]
MAPSSGTLTRAGTTAWALLGIIALVLVSGWALGRLMAVFLPFVIAILLTTLLRPAAAALERRGVRPALAAIAAVGLAVVVLALLLTLILPPFISRLTELGTSVQEGAHRVAYEVGDRVAGMSHREVDRTIDNAVTRVRDRLGGTAMAGVTSAAGALASLVLIAFLSFFLVKDGRRLWRYVVDLLPESRRDSVDEVGERAWTVLTAYTRGVVFVATVDAVLIGAALLLVGVPLALPLIVLTWLAAFFPIVGAVTAGAAAVLVALVANGPTSALIVLAAIVLVQQIEGNVLYPVVVGPRLRLHPIVVLLAVALGGTLAGISGAFLAVPVATVCSAALSYWRDRRDQVALSRPPARRGVMVSNGAP